MCDLIAKDTKKIITIWQSKGKTVVYKHKRKRTWNIFYCGRFEIAKKFHIPKGQIGLELTESLFFNDSIVEKVRESIQVQLAFAKAIGGDLVQGFI
ncbi:MAG: hypothetical protein Q4F24_17830 [Eubacteriales bacterium]|nr:hypothetical protein [Eubacteriales bacterium]